MLTRYLENRYPFSDNRERRVFLQLLELEDSELIRYLLGEQVPANPELQGIVASIRVLPVEQQ